MTSATRRSRAEGFHGFVDTAVSYVLSVRRDQIVKRGRRRIVPTASALISPCHPCVHGCDLSPCRVDDIWLAIFHDVVIVPPHRPPVASASLRSDLVRLGVDDGSGMQLREFVRMPSMRGANTVTNTPHRAALPVHQTQRDRA